MRNKIVILFSTIALLVAIQVKSQTTIVVQSILGSTQTYSLSDNGKLYFASTNLIIYDGTTQVSVPLNEIQKIYFAQNSSVEDLNIASTQNIALYPNPANNVIRLKNLNSSTLVSIYSMEGRLVLSKECASDESIDVSCLQKGFYVVRASNKSFKLIKQ
jgi:hypothetical protein